MTLETRQRIGRALWISGAIAVALATLTPSDQRDAGTGLCVICGDLAGVDLLLNVLLFVPIGCGLALAGVRAPVGILAACAASILIETLQLFSIPGRDASLGDVLSNSLGAALGFVIASRAATWLWPVPARARLFLGFWMALWTLIQLAGGYVLRPHPTGATYHGQIARELGGRPPFPGEVLRPTISGEVIPDHVLPADQAQRLRRAFAANAAIVADVVVVGRSMPAWQSPIVRIADRNEREIFLIASHQSDFVVGVRTRASRLRLRPPLYRLSDAFQRVGGDVGPKASAAHDTTRARATFLPDQVRIVAATGGGGTTRSGRIRLTAAGFWRLLWPIQLYVDESPWNRLMDAMWVFALLLPVGYWLWFVPVSGGVRRGAMVVGCVAGAWIVAGLVVVPATFGVAFPAWTELLAAVAGVIAGALAGRTVTEWRRRIANLRRAT